MNTIDGNFFARLRRWAGKDYVWLSTFLLAGAGLYFSGNLSAGTAFRIPPPAVDIKAANGPGDLGGAPPGAHQTVVLAGGCF